MGDAHSHTYSAPDITPPLSSQIVYEMAVGFGVLFLYGSYALEVWGQGAPPSVFKQHSFCAV
jgi:hypothetical protein